MSIYSLSSLTNTTKLQSTNQGKLQFQKGQIISGKILYIDSQNNVLVQVQGQKFLAKLEVPIDVARNYYFQVQETEGKILLKVLENVTNIESLLNALQIPNNKKMARFIQTWLNTNLPLNRNLVQNALHWLQLTNDPNNVIQTMKLMQAAKLPFTNGVFQSLHSLNHTPSMTTLLNQLQQQLVNHGEYHQLNQLIEQFMGKSNSHMNSTLQQVNWASSASVQKAIQFIINLLGYNAEAQLVNGKQVAEIPLKWQLMNIMQADKQLPTGLKTVVEQLVFKITGNQLLATNTDSFFQCSISIPIPLPDQTIDAQFQFRGKKDEKGQLDKDFCQIVFDLTMPNIGKLNAFMHVQNRVITLLIKSNHSNLENLSKDLIASLKKELAKNDYILSSVRFERLSTHAKNINMSENLPAYHSIGNLDVKI